MKHNRVSIAFALPAGIIYTVLLIIPILMAFGISFSKWNGISQIRFIGADNYIKLAQDARLGDAACNTLIVMLTVVVAVNALGLLVAILLNKTRPINNFLRTTYFIPVVLSTVAVSFVWKSILSYTGVLNALLHLAGLENMAVNSMAGRASALTSICVVEIWKNFGYHMMLYVAGLQTVPQELYEACTVDGGNAWHRFRNVTVPMILPVASVSVIMSVINELRIYDVIKVMTDGGPGYATESVVYNIVAQGFSNNRMGYACAISVVLFLVIAVISVTIINRGNKMEAN
jgi:ABC-type sugar transport system permease subunit